jgi:hypothetical protein
MNGLRYQHGQSFKERMERGASDVEELRTHRGYLYLMDMLDAELRTLWRQWTHLETSPSQAEQMRQRAMWLSDLIKSIDGKTSEQAWLQEQDRIFTASYTDDALLAEAAAAARGSPDSGTY